MKYKHDHLYKNEKKKILITLQMCTSLKTSIKTKILKNYLFAGVMLFQIKIFVDFVEANRKIRL